MDYHIVPNLTHQTEQVKPRHRHNDWHFEATLFGAGILILLLTFVPRVVSTKQDSQVLGISTNTDQQKILGRVYDSQFGYYKQVEEIEDKNFFSQLVKSFLSLLN